LSERLTVSLCLFDRRISAFAEVTTVSLTACFGKPNLVLLGFFLTVWTFHTPYFNLPLSPLPVITYLLIQNIIGKSEIKEKLIINMRSKVRDIALQAAEELRQSNWLTDGSLKNANLNGADLRGAELYNANLIEAVLTGANLSGTKLAGANLSGANLFNANLSNAILNSADLNGANLRQTNLYGADLSPVYNLNNANLNGAWYSDKTKWPDGFDPETAGAILVYVDGKRVYQQSQ
jgi:hypothetical protein